MPGRITVRVEGAKEVIRAARKVPRQGKESLRSSAHDLAGQLADRARANAAAQGRQARRAAQGVKVHPGAFMPTIDAGESPLLFGTEFGATRHFGWYAAARYFDSRGKQFPPHRGGGSYWFLRTVTNERALIERTWRDALADVVRKWSA